MAALRLAGKRFANILPVFAAMLILLAISTSFLPDEVILRWFRGGSEWTGMAVALFVGSLTLMPGFIAFPLCGVLLTKGVPYMVLSAFTMSLMTVGILTFPLEQRYFGTKVTLLRNAVSLVIAVIVAVVTGLVFMEIP